MSKSYHNGKCDFRGCKGCRYLGFINGGTPLCNYLIYTGKRRGCPAGKDCTRKEKGKPIRDPFGDDLGFGGDYE